MLLISGGYKDFNIQFLYEYLHRNNLEFHIVLLQEKNKPELTWDLNQDVLIINGIKIKPSAIFSREDVFNSLGDDSDKFTSRTWHQTLKSYAMAHPKVKYFNKGYVGMNKTYNLFLAQKIGLKIPRTVITNQMELLVDLENADQHIVKPVLGGQLTQTLETFLEKNKITKSDRLSFVQSRLIQPEVRVYGIGNEFKAFNVFSEQLDYRGDKSTKISETEVSPEIIQKLKVLMKYLKMDFCAADFKTCPDTGDLLFLEVNSSPMFGAFDKISDFSISEKIAEWHLKEVTV